MANNRTIKYLGDKQVTLEQVTIIARRRASEFESSADNADCDDEEADGNTVRAYRSMLRYVRHLSKFRPEIKWQNAKLHTRPFLRQISRKYWTDFDYDNRVRSVNVKKEAIILINSLKKTINLLQSVSEPVQRGINLQAKSVIPHDRKEIDDVYNVACITNEALLHACQQYVGQKHLKKGNVRFKNAAVALIKMCESVMGRDFRGGRPMAKAADQKRARGVNREFVGDPDAQFIFVALNGIDRGVKPAHVETALRDILGK